MTGPEYFSLEASGRPMLVIGRSYFFYPRGLPLSLLVRVRGGQFWTQVRSRQIKML